MVHTAVAYAKMKNRLQTFACTSSIGPGATNMITGAAIATVNRLPVLLLPGDIFASRRPDPVLQQLEYSLSAWTSASTTASARSRASGTASTGRSRLLASLPEAMRVLTDQAETGAVTIALAAGRPDRGATTTRRISSRSASPRHRACVPPASECSQRAVELIRRAKRPLIIAGGGVIYSEATAALGPTSPIASASRSRNPGGQGRAALEPRLERRSDRLERRPRRRTGWRREADLVIAVGTRLADFTTASHTAFQNPGRPLRRAQRRPRRRPQVRGAARWSAMRGRDYPGADRGALPAPVFVPRRRTASRSARSRPSGTRPSTAIRAVETPQALTQANVIGIVNEAARPRDVVVCAAGGMPGDLLKLWRPVDPKGYHLEYGYSCMGYEIAGGLGVKMADPIARGLRDGRRRQLPDAAHRDRHLAPGGAEADHRRRRQRRLPVHPRSADADRLALVRQRAALPQSPTRTASTAPTSRSTSPRTPRASAPSPSCDGRGVAARRRWSGGRGGPHDRDPRPDQPGRSRCPASRAGGTCRSPRSPARTVSAQPACPTWRLKSGSACSSSERRRRQLDQSSAVSASSNWWCSSHKVGCCSRWDVTGCCRLRSPGSAGSRHPPRLRRWPASRPPCSRRPRHRDPGAAPRARHPLRVRILLGGRHLAAPDPADARAWVPGSARAAGAGPVVAGNGVAVAQPHRDDLARLRHLDGRGPACCTWSTGGTTARSSAATTPVWTTNRPRHRRRVAPTVVPTEPSSRTQRRVAIISDASASMSSLDRDEAIVLQPLLPDRVDMAVHDRRPMGRRDEVVEHGDAAWLDEVGECVDVRHDLAHVDEEQRERVRTRSSVDQSPAMISTLSTSANRLCTSSASTESSSALTMRAFGRAPDASQAEPTPVPVPSSAKVPSRDAASAASKRPVSWRVEVMNPRWRARSSALATSSGTAGGPVTRAHMLASAVRVDSDVVRVCGLSLSSYAEAARSHRLPRQVHLGPSCRGVWRWPERFRRRNTDHI